MPVHLAQDDRAHVYLMVEKPVAVEFDAEMRQIKSMADGTCNLVLNVPEYCLPQVQAMLGWLKDMVRVVMVQQAESDR